MKQFSKMNVLMKENPDELKFLRVFTKPNVHPFDEIEWDKRDATISDAKGNVIFEQKNVEIPKNWSQSATKIVVSKYFRGQLGTPQREHSVKQMISRVANTISEWGKKGSYFLNDDEYQTFKDELTHILVNQMAAFNSPVWFNLGVETKPQSSACFINSVKDDMRSILNLAVTEGMLFKGGSGTGSNLSNIRSSKEYLNGGGKASGPVSFMKGYDAFAGVIKSGGKTRRAAKMVILNIDHPDIIDFIDCKVREEKKAHTLIEAGYESSIDGDVYSNIFFQNANNSVRVTDEFMKALIDDKTYATKFVTNGQPCETLRARDVMRRISTAAHACGDPGLQYDTTINRWHTSPNSGRINASNPCVTGDTKVLTKDGRWIRIDKLIGKESEIIVNTGLITTSKISGSFETGSKPVYRLSTKSGYELKLTGDHKVFTANRGFVQAAELTKDDFLLIPGTKVADITEPEDKPFYQMIGAYLGDGCGTTLKAVQLTMNKSEEKEVLNVFQKYVASFQRTTHKNSPSTVLETATTSKLNILNHRVIEKIATLVDLSRYSHEKVISDELFALTLGQQKYVLQGLFTTDGTVANYGEKSQYVALDSTSLGLLQGVQTLLLGFGIKSKLYKNRRAGKLKSFLPDGKGGLKEYNVKEMHSLRISRSSRKLFEELIGFMPESKKAQQLKELNEQIETYTDLPLERVDSLEYVGVENVYDLTEPLTHTFVANGITIHNCSEFIYLDDTACNLASINLMKCRTVNGDLDVEKFKHIVEILICAQEILVGFSSYPTEAIEKNSHDFRPLGLGYANIGALLMARGFAYDSDEARNYAAAITALMSGHGYKTSALIAQRVGSCAGYKVNEEPFLNVIDMHRSHAYQIGKNGVQEDLLKAAQKSWDEAAINGLMYGFKNCQISVLAPTGTIGFLMDCDTTGVEPEIALVKYKWLVGGGMMKLVNATVPEALKRLGYNEGQIQDILNYVNEKDTIENAPHLKDEHLPVFDCSFKATNGKRSIHYMGHLKMMAAVQPFISGAISKTINMPEEATVEDIEGAYIEGWRLGLKAVAIYRDGSKKTQPLTTSKESAAKTKMQMVQLVGTRKRLPDERRSITHKFAIGGHEGYLTAGMYEDGTPGEIFVVMAKEGTAISGMMDSFSTAISLSLQYGVPLKVLANKFLHTRFEPSGVTGNEKIRFAKSIVDYIFKWMSYKFLTKDEQEEVGLDTGIYENSTIENTTVREATPTSSQPRQLQQKTGDAVKNAQRLTFQSPADAPLCSFCGSLMVKNAACYKCANCGTTSGCS